MRSFIASIARDRASRPFMGILQDGARAL
jgi:hypothetical protein